jgi:hypothetical protein
MHLSIEKHTRWTIEFVRPLYQSIPTTEILLTSPRLTCSRHKSGVGPGSADRSYIDDRFPPAYHIFNLPGGSELKVTGCLPNYQVDTLQETDNPPVKERPFKPPRYRGLRRRLSKMLYAFSRDKADRSSFEQLPSYATNLQELQGSSTRIELEEPRPACELPTSSDIDAVPQNDCAVDAVNGRMYRHPGDNASYDLQPDADYAQAQIAPYGVPCSVDHEYLLPKSPMISPIGLTNQSFTTQHLSPPTNMTQPTHIKSYGNGPFRAKTPSLSITPVGPGCAYGSYQQSPYISPQSSMPSSGTGSSLTTPSSYSWSPADASAIPINNQLMSPAAASTRRKSFTTESYDPSPLQSLGRDGTYPFGPDDFLSPQEIQESVTTDSSFAFANQFESLDSPTRDAPTTYILGSMVSPPPPADHQRAGVRQISENKGRRKRPQDQRTDPLHLDILAQEQDGCDDAPPTYSPPDSVNSSSWEAAATHMVESRNQVSTQCAQRGKARSPSASCMALFPPLRLPPLRCGYPQCDKVFNGMYQKGNRSRHVRQMHSVDPALFTCRYPSCYASYKRDDARRKHEWKKHRMEDSRPEKRRNEKRNKESVIARPMTRP